MGYIFTVIITGIIGALIFLFVGQIFGGIVVFGLVGGTLIYIAYNLELVNDRLKIIEEKLSSDDRNTD